MSQIGGRANKRLGQHFLIDRAVLDVIVIAADIHPGDLVLEIGPGLGVLTKELLAKGAEVVAIEKDKRFADFLAGAIHELPLRVVTGDAAAIHWHTLIDPSTSLGASRPWKLISNLPYSITSLALRKALWAPHPASRVVVLVQREVAERAVTVARNVIASPDPHRGEAISLKRLPRRSAPRNDSKGKTSLLSLMVALASRDVRIVKRVTPGSFYPPPNVESAILEIIPMTLADREKRWGIDPEKIMALAKRGFAHPRKLLASNLGLKKICVDGIPEKARSENLSPEDWARLAQKLA